MVDLDPLVLTLVLPVQQLIDAILAQIVPTIACAVNNDLFIPYMPPDHKFRRFHWKKSYLLITLGCRAYRNIS